MSASVRPARMAKALPRDLVLAAFAAWLWTVGPAGAAGVEKRCGWLENPTPGNWWLKDSRGPWTIAEQGGPYADGMERLASPKAEKFVATNGNYGYSCACVTGVFDSTASRVTRIDETRTLELSVCKADDGLPAP
jgi:hypothetical protein